MDAIVVLVTTSDADEGKRIAHRLLDTGLIACASLVQNVSSFFMWRGAKTQTDECIVVMKTLHSCFPELCRQVRALHSYEVPEILALPVLDGDEAYLSWVKETAGGS